MGCNVENASYGATICAERSAVCQMIAAGERHPIACAIASAGAVAASPCGICRQVLAEFARDMPIALVLETSRGIRRRDTTLATLLPDAFRFD
jgi:cytidine deaminase